METHRLICHPDTSAQAVRAVVVTSEWADDWLSLSYAVSGADQVRWPEPAEPERRDGLWQTTCAECFIMPQQGPGYVEFNFSPSGAWAAYRFEDYRLEPEHFAMQLSPQIDAVAGTVLVTLSVEAVQARMGLSMVIEELDGTKSYWALAHPPGAPDFHHPACFAHRVEPPSMP